MHVSIYVWRPGHNAQVSSSVTFPSLRHCLLPSPELSNTANLYNQFALGVLCLCISSAGIKQAATTTQLLCRCNRSNDQSSELNGKGFITLSVHIF